MAQPDINRYGAVRFPQRGKAIYLRIIVCHAIVNWIFLGNSLQWILACRNFIGDALGRAPMGEHGKQYQAEGKDEL